VASAVRIPTPEPPSSPQLKRKRVSPSQSPHRPSKHATVEIRQPRSRPAQPEPVSEEQKQAAAKKEFDALRMSRGGGAYIPPAKLRAMQAQLSDKKSLEWQKMEWEAGKKTINGLINKVTGASIKHIIPSMFEIDLVRHRGSFCKSLMRAQQSSEPFSPVFACMASVVGSKLPQVTELLITRLLVAFRKSLTRNDRAVARSTSTFLAQLANFGVMSETTVAQMLLTLLNKPTDDSIEIAANVLKQSGAFLEEVSPGIAGLVFDRLREILHEGTNLEKRSQYILETLFVTRQEKYKDNPPIPEELDILEESDMVTHNISLDDESLNPKNNLNVFKFDPDYEEHEEQFNQLKRQILGEESGSEEEEGSDDESEESEEDAAEKAVEINDQTNLDLVSLRRAIYLTLKSSNLVDDATHRLLRIQIPQGSEPELVSMVLATATEARTFETYYGNIGARLSKLNRFWKELFEDEFRKQYETAHRLDTNKLRITAAFFAHLLSTDGIGWEVFEVIHLNEEETTSSSRIMIKILFEEITSNMGMATVAARFKEEALQPYLGGVFPKDDPKNTRFSINFFTAIGMGVLTEDMREYLQRLQESQPALVVRDEDRSDSESVSSYSSYSSRSRSPSRSPSRTREPRREPGGRGRGRSAASSRSYSSSRSRSPPRRGRGDAPISRRREASVSMSRSPSRSRTPPRRNNRSAHDENSRSRSPSSSRSRPRRSGNERPGDARREGQRTRNSSSDSRSSRIN
jgi:pre-mRNA-splicing factor CWC22